MSNISKWRFFFQKIYYWKLYCKGRIGKNVLLSQHGTVINPQEVTIGDNVFISEYFHISAYHFRIGNDVIIGPRLTAICNNHKFDVPEKSVFEISKVKEYKPIIIENDVWIGANVTLLPGVTIGKGCIIGAGSVVTKSMPQNMVCVGVPCKPIKKRFPCDEYTCEGDSNYTR